MAGLEGHLEFEGFNFKLFESKQLVKDFLPHNLDCKTESDLRKLSRSIRFQKDVRWLAANLGEEVHHSAGKTGTGFNRGGAMDGGSSGLLEAVRDSRERDHLSKWLCRLSCPPSRRPGACGMLPLQKFIETIISRVCLTTCHGRCDLNFEKEERRKWDSFPLLWGSGSGCYEIDNPASNLVTDIGSIVKGSIWKSHVISYGDGRYLITVCLRGSRRARNAGKRSCAWL